ncbi:histidine kinase dimerization/phospho-acceptor domain-containing protein [Candidatus Xenohaliotis californiensis]
MIIWLMSTTWLVAILLVLKKIFSNHYISTINAIPVPVYYISNSLLKGFANHNLRNLLNISKNTSKPEEFLTKHIKEETAIFPLIKMTINSNTTNNTSISLKNKSKKFLCTIAPTTRKNKNLGVIIIFNNTMNILSDLEKKEQEVRKIQNTITDYQQVFNQLPYLVWIRNKNMNIDYFNNEYYKFIEDRHIGNHSDIAELSNECIILAQQTITTKNNVEYTISLTNKNTLHTISLVEIPLLHNGGTMGIGHDITYSKQLEKDNLIISDAYKKFLSSLSNAIGIYNSSRHLTFYNDSFAHIFNFDQAWLNTKPSYEEILEKMRENRKLPEQANFLKFKEEQINLFNNLIDVHNEFHYLPDNTALRVVIIPGAKGDLLFSYEDITDKLTMEQSYNTAVAVSKTTINNLHEAIAVYGDNGRLNLFNPALRKMWDIDSGYLKTMPHISEVLESTKGSYRPENWEKFRENEILAITNKIAGKKNFKLKNGKYINRNISLLPNGAVLVTYYEVTATKLLEKSLREKNNMLTELASLKSNLFSSISYELRSPLTSIIGFAEMLLNFYKEELKPDNLHYISNIYQSAQELSQIINNMLDFSFIENGVVDLQKQNIEITSIIQSLKQELKNNMRSVTHTNIDCSEIKNIIVQVDSKLIVKGFVHLAKYASQLLGKVNIINFTKHLQQNNKDKNNVTICITLCNDLNAKTSSGCAKPRENDDVTNVNLTITKRFIEWHGGSLKILSSSQQSISFACVIPMHDEKIKA